MEFPSRKYCVCLLVALCAVMLTLLPVRLSAVTVEVNLKAGRVLITTFGDSISITDIEAKMQELMLENQVDFGHSVVKEFVRNRDIVFSVMIDSMDLQDPALLIHGQLFNIRVYYQGQELFKRMHNPNPKPFPLFDCLVIPLPCSNGGMLSVHIQYNDVYQIGYMEVAHVGERTEILELGQSIIIARYNNLMIAMFLAGFFMIGALILLIISIAYYKQHNGLLFYIFIFALGCGFDQIDTVFNTKLAYMLGLPPVIVLQYIVLIPIGFWGILKRIMIKKRNWLFNIIIGANALSGVSLALFSIQFFTLYNAFIIIQLILAVLVIAFSAQFKSKPFIMVSSGMLIYILFIANSIFPVVPHLEYLSAVGAVPLFVILCWLGAHEYNQNLEQFKDVSGKLESVQMQLVRLENRNLQSQFEALRNQLNPHFLFNSLNVLSSLIKRDQGKSVQFVELFSDIYRYVLQSRSQTLVPFEKELDFVKSFFALQQFRYAANIQLSLDVANVGRAQIPPLAIQLLVENSIKHNEISKEFPLVISIRFCPDTDQVVICNPIRKVAQEAPSMGLGLDNLIKRYSIMDERSPVIEEKDGMFCVSLPLIRDI
jgi:hypothetical protein